MFIGISIPAIGRGDEDVVAVQPPASRRKIPFPNVVMDAGKSNGYQILRLAKRTGWGETLKRGKRIGWADNHKSLWFGPTGMFRMYKEINGSRISKFMSDLLNHTKSNFPID